MGPCVPALQCSTLLRREPPHQPLIDLGGAAQHVQVFGDGTLHLGPLHLDRHHLARLLQHRAVHLGERGGGDGVGAELFEDVVDRTAQLLLDDLAGDGSLEALDAVLSGAHDRCGHEPDSPGRYARGDGLGAGGRSGAEILGPTRGEQGRALLLLHSRNG